MPAAAPNFYYLTINETNPHHKKILQNVVSHKTKKL